MLMKKIVYIIALLLAVVLCLSACGNNTNPGNSSTTQNQDVEEKDANGHVVKLSHYNDKGDLVFVHETKWENDRIVKKTSFDGKGNQTASIDYKYDDNGNAIETSWFGWSSGVLMKAESKFDDKNREIERTQIGTGSISTNKSIMEYVEFPDGVDHPNIYSKKTYYPSYPGDRYTVTTYEYNDDYKMTKATTVDQNGNLSYYILYTYENGKLMEYTNYGADDKPSYTYKMVYDENGNKLREDRYDGNGNLQGVSQLVRGQHIDDVIKRLDGIRCGTKGTSCPDQLCRALEQLKQAPLDDK